MIELFPPVLKLESFPPVEAVVLTVVVATVVLDCETELELPFFTYTVFVLSAPLSEMVTSVLGLGHPQAFPLLVFVPPVTDTTTVFDAAPVVMLELPPILKLEVFLPVFALAVIEVVATVVLL